jgi:hypothetical protein
MNISHQLHQMQWCALIMDWVQEHIGIKLLPKKQSSVGIYDIQNNTYLTPALYATND